MRVLRPAGLGGQSAAECSAVLGAGTGAGPAPSVWPVPLPAPVASCPVGRAAACVCAPCAGDDPGCRPTAASSVSPAPASTGRSGRSTSLPACATASAVASAGCGRRQHAQPGRRAEHLAQPLQGDAEQGAHDLGVELAAAAPDQILPRAARVDRPLVGPVGGHDLEGVRDRDDPRAEADLGPSQTGGVALPVSPLVVLPDGVEPRAEEGQQAPRRPGALGRVLPDQRPLGLVQPGRLAQHAHVDRGLATSCTSAAQRSRSR